LKNQKRQSWRIETRGKVAKGSRLPLDESAHVTSTLWCQVVHESIRHCYLIFPRRFPSSTKWPRHLNQGSELRTRGFS
jgi:hypothetical protein